MKTPKRQISFLDRKEVEQIILSIEPKGRYNLRDRALIEVLFSTGLRIAEALALPDAPFVKETASTMELSIVGKGGWQRTIYFSPSALQAIKGYLRVRKDSSTRLFPIGSRQAQIVVKKRAAEAGITKRVTPHIFRHSLATYLLKKGANIYYVQQFLGHRAISSTTVYLHATNRELKNIHERLMA